MLTCCLGAAMGGPPKCAANTAALGVGLRPFPLAAVPLAGAAPRPVLPAVELLDVMCPMSVFMGGAASQLALPSVALLHAFDVV